MRTLSPALLTMVLTACTPPTPERTYSDARARSRTAGIESQEESAPLASLTSIPWCTIENVNNLKIVTRYTFAANAFVVDHLQVTPGEEPIAYQGGESRFFMSGNAPAAIRGVYIANLVDAKAAQSAPMYGEQKLLRQEVGGNSAAELGREGGVLVKKENIELMLYACSSYHSAFSAKSNARPNLELKLLVAAHAPTPRTGYAKVSLQSLSSPLKTSLIEPAALGGTRWCAFDPAARLVRTLVFGAETYATSNVRDVDLDKQVPDKSALLEKKHNPRDLDEITTTATQAILGRYEVKDGGIKAIGTNRRATQFKVVEDAKGAQVLVTETTRDFDVPVLNPGEVYFLCMSERFPNESADYTKNLQRLLEIQSRLVK